MSAEDLSPEAMETLAEAIHRSCCDCERGPHDGHRALAPTVAALIAQHVEAARADEAQRVRERVEALPTTRTKAWDRGWDSVSLDDVRAALATPDPEAAG